MHINDLELYFMILQQIKNDLDNLLLCLWQKHVCYTPVFSTSMHSQGNSHPPTSGIGLTIWFVSSCPFILSSLFLMYISTWLAFLRTQKLNTLGFVGQEKIEGYLCVYTTKRKQISLLFLLNKLKM